MEYEIVTIDSSKISWLQKTLKEASLEKRDLFSEFAFWILELGRARLFETKNRKNVLFHFNRVSGEFKYSCEKVVVESFFSDNFDLLSVHQPLVDFLEFFFCCDSGGRKEKIFLEELLPYLTSLEKDPLKIHGPNDSFVTLLKNNAERDLKEFLDVHKRKTRCLDALDENAF